MKRTWKLLPVALLMTLTAYTQTAANAMNEAPPSTCQVLCATTYCQSNSDCPSGRCDFVCPGEGCCVE
jgi:hypothetical protein